MIQQLKQRLQVIALLACLVLPAAMWARVNFMSIEVPVSNYSQKALHQSLVQALSQVLVKVSGNPGVMTLPQVQNELPKINELVSAYSYKTQTLDDNGQAALQLNVTFNHRAIKQVLSSAGQSVWSADRPSTLVWLTVDDEHGQQHVSAGSESQSAMAAALVHDANSRGLRLIFPMMDLNDQSYMSHQVTQAQLNVSQVQQASKRYGVSSILSGTVTSIAGQWQADWLYVLDGAPIRWQDEAGSIDQLALNAVNNLASTMISQLAMASPDQGQSLVLLRVSGVDDLSQYAMVQEYLRGLKPVTKVTVETVDSSQLVLRVDYQGSLSELKRRLQQGQRMTPQAGEWLQQKHDDPKLAYRWQGGMG